MGLSSQNLEAFFHCAQEQNFTRAAEHLMISQSALSQRVLNLEAELETTLFIRSRTGVTLTPAGIELLNYYQAKESLEEEVLAKIKNPIRGEVSGSLRIGGFSSIMRSAILPALAPLLCQHSGIRLTFLNREIKELPQLMRQGEIDFMIIYSKEHREGMEHELLGYEENVLVEKKGYSGPNIYLDHDENDQITGEYLSRHSKSEKKYDRRFLDDVYGLIDGVRMGLGRAVIPRHLIANDKSLKIINPRKKLKIPVVLHYRQQPYYTILHQKVIEVLKDNFKNYI